MDNPVVNIGKRKNDRDEDYDPTQLCDHCRIKLGRVLLKNRGGSINETLFEFGGHLFQVKCLR